jgi:hypothetical protein
VFPVILLAWGAASGICWAVERHTTGQLQQQLDETKDRAGEIARLRTEHDRLLGLQGAEMDPRTARGRASAIDSVPEGPAYDGATTLRPGSWAPASAWRNQGRATPEAAVETMLWAAAGGDLKTLKDTLVLAPDAQSKAANLLARLPSAPGEPLASPEDLMALLVAGNVPLDSAQVVARQISGDGQVVEYLRLKDSGGRTRQVYLALQKASDAWTLTVPASALEQMIQAQPGSSAP